MTHADRRARLAAVLACTEAPGTLADACGLIAQGESSDVDIDSIHDTLNGWARPLRNRTTVRDPAAALRDLLGEELGFRGDAEEYDDPDNSLIDRVIERRRGLPILLSVIWVEVARRAGVPATGIALPGHFVARVGVGDVSRIVDPFGGGHVLTEEAALALGARAMGSSERLDPKWLHPASATSTVRRILVNLEASYSRRGDLDRVERAVSDHVSIAADDAALHVRRADVYEQLGRPSEALEDLNTALRLMRYVPQSHEIWERARRLARRGESEN